MENKGQVLSKLFISTLYLSAFTFGGGYVIVTLMKKKFVDQYHWIEENEMLDLIAIAQSSPGAIAVNASILIGYRIAGLISGYFCTGCDDTSDNLMSWNDGINAPVPVIVNHVQV